MADNPAVNLVDMNSPGLDFAPGVAKRRHWSSAGGGGYIVPPAETDHTIRLDAFPDGFILCQAAAATVRIPLFKAAPFKPDMQISVAVDKPTSALTLAPNPLVRLVIDEDPVLKALSTDGRTFRFTGANNGFSIRNLGRDLWLLMRSDRPIREYDGQTARVLANQANGLPDWWPRD